MKDSFWRSVRKRTLFPSKEERRAQAILNKYTKTRTEESKFVLRCLDDVNRDHYYGNVFDRSSSSRIYIQRPDHAQFYDYSACLNILSNGHTIVGINDASNRSQKLLEFKYSPLHFFCRDNIDVVDYSDVSLEEDVDGIITIYLTDKDGAQLTLTFNKDYVLKRFAIVHIDKDEAIAYEFLTTKKNVKFEKDFFRRPEPYVTQGPL
ncbi:outer-membrane lipoprotein carrier protein LolA [Bartonella sp. TP]|uniref:LolA family protein n=1 Tax=Bartonella sp. TP TaxID=3057550 RepID=UPI0025AFCBBC|nr:outer-membrane lipoprotein carrier protein LolA [Bartonella sp. TP]WJW79527.1 outer-membrane lipoprotein carrier protein LolA [Bartonella sp. TP]